MVYEMLSGGGQQVGSLPYLLKKIKNHNVRDFDLSYRRVTFPAIQESEWPATYSP